MRPFSCSVCGQLLFFDNSTCLRCHAPVGFLPDELMVDSAAPFLAWPIAALVGVLLVSWGRGREPDSYERDTDATTAPVIDTRT